MELRSTPMAGRVYSKEEVDAILARAIELQGHGEATSHAELAAIAREIGIPPEALEKAAAEVLTRRRDDQTMRALRARQWRGFYAHLVPYLSVGILLGFINMATGGFPWAVIPMLAWGIGLASHLLAVALPDAEKLKRRVDRERERRDPSTWRAPQAGQERRGGRVRVEGAPVASDLDALRAEREADAEQALEKRSGRG